MATSKIRSFLFIAVPVLILMLPLSIYFVDSAAASDKVARNVTIAGVDVARQTEIEATASVGVYTRDLTTRITRVDVNGTIYELDPDDVGLAFNSSNAVNEALTIRKDGITDWLGAFSTEVDVPLAASLDPEMVELVLTQWEQDAIANPAYEGSVAISNGTVTSEYPRQGQTIDRDQSVALLLEAIQNGTSAVVMLPIVESTPVLTDADIDSAVREAHRIINRGVVLTNTTYEFEFRVTPEELGNALQATLVEDTATPTIEFSVDPSAISPLVEAVSGELEIAPVDAGWKTSLADDFEGYPDQYKITDSPKGTGGDDWITLVPAVTGTTVDPDEVAVAVEVAALGTGVGELPVVEETQPSFTTEDAEAFGKLYELAEFTTYTPGQNRVANIHLMADLVDQSVVMPGKTFSVNDTVGQRTLEKGFKYDCAIVGGEVSCEEDQVNLGGGVSQFGTTIFNTIYFSCLEDVVHQPHSIYFRKYPEGREATLGFPHPDVAFRNDTEAPVIIRTSYTGRSVTVTFFGNNDGIKCKTERSERTNFKEATTIYRADDTGTVPPGEEVVSNGGSGGWRVVNTRIFYDSSGKELKRETFPWTYRGERKVILMHPCEPKVGGNGNCPVGVPGVNGMSQGEATATLTSAGFKVAVNPVTTSIESQDGIVLSASPSGKQSAGTTITIDVGAWDGSGTEPTTTTTTAPPDE